MRMTRRLELTSWFRRRMVPLVLSCAVVVAAAAPGAYYVQKRQELLLQARADAARVADVLRGEIEQRPLLWRYNAPKLAERLNMEGLGRLPRVVVRDAQGGAVPLEGGQEALPAGVLWGRAEVIAYGRQQAMVWVARGTAPLRLGTAKLAAAFVLLSVMLSLVLYLLPMRAIGAAERRVEALLGQLAQALQEEDRRRIARDLHDGAGQAITAARLQLAALRRSTGDNPAVARIAAHLDEALSEVRRSTCALLPPALAALGLCGALSRHCEAFAAATGLMVSCQVEELPREPPEDVATACYRIVQEALTNIARHAGASRAWVRLVPSGAALLLTISDDGSGMPAGAPAGSGLRSICERARLLHGTVAVTPGPERGTRIEVTLPLLDACHQAVGG